MGNYASKKTLTKNNVLAYADNTLLPVDAPLGTIAFVEDIKKFYIKYGITEWRLLVESSAYAGPVSYTLARGPIDGLVTESDTMTVYITAINVPNGTSVNYSWSGIDADDIEPTDSLTGSAVIVEGAASVTVTLANDLTTEGEETAVFTLNDTDSVGNFTESPQISFTIEDTSTDPIAYALSPMQGDDAAAVIGTLQPNGDYFLTGRVGIISSILRASSPNITENVYAEIEYKTGTTPYLFLGFASDLQSDYNLSDNTNGLMYYNGNHYKNNGVITPTGYGTWSPGNILQFGLDVSTRTMYFSISDSPIMYTFTLAPGTGNLYFTIGSGSSAQTDLQLTMRSQTSQTYKASFESKTGVQFIPAVWSIPETQPQPNSPTGQQLYTNPGTYLWTAPEGVTSVSVVTIGGGGAGYDNPSSSTILWAAGGGGALGYKNDIPVVPGQTYTVQVGAGALYGNDDVNIGTSDVYGAEQGSGGRSLFIDASTVSARGGRRYQDRATFVGDGGGQGGLGGYSYPNQYAALGGGGAGGYAGNGGDGGSDSTAGSRKIDGTAGTGGGGGGGASDMVSSAWAGSFYAGGGGGVGVNGLGASGAGGTHPAGSTRDLSQTAGKGGSAGADGHDVNGDAPRGGAYGGGGGIEYHKNVGGTTATNFAPNKTWMRGEHGAVRIIWPGDQRQFPSTRTADELDVIGQIAYTTPGTYTWTCPDGVTLVSAVAVGSTRYWDNINGTAGGGGGLGWKNDIAVTPGQTYTVQVGGHNGTTTVTNSYFINELTVMGGSASGRAGGTYYGDGGGIGGFGGSGNNVRAGGGGAGGYTGAGGNGGGASSSGSSAVAGSGGGGGGAGGNIDTFGGGGGGVGIFGLGDDGAGGTWVNQANWADGGGKGGSGGGDGGPINTSGAQTPAPFGGGVAGMSGGTVSGGPTGNGAVRLIWGPGRAFPSTRTADE